MSKLILNLLTYINPAVSQGGMCQTLHGQCCWYIQWKTTVGNLSYFKIQPMILRQKYSPFKCHCYTFIVWFVGCRKIGFLLMSQWENSQTWYTCYNIDIFRCNMFLPCMFLPAYMGERFYEYWSPRFGSFLTNFLLVCLLITVQPFCTWNSIWFSEGLRICDLWHSFWEVWHFHLLWHFFPWPSGGAGKQVSSWQRSLSHSLVQHAAPPLGCSLPLCLGQGHGSQPACSQYPQHQHAHDR